MVVMFIAFLMLYIYSVVFLHCPFKSVCFYFSWYLWKLNCDLDQSWRVIHFKGKRRKNKPFMLLLEEIFHVQTYSLFSQWIVKCFSPLCRFTSVLLVADIKSRWWDKFEDPESIREDMGLLDSWEGLTIQRSPFFFFLGVIVIDHYCL